MTVSKTLNYSPPHHNPQGRQREPSDHVDQIFDLLKEGEALVDKAHQAKTEGDLSAESDYLDEAAKLLQRANDLEDAYLNETYGTPLSDINTCDESNSARRTTTQTHEMIKEEATS